DELAVRGGGAGRGDLLEATHDATQDEVAHGPGLRRRPRLRAVIRDRRLAARGAAAAGPAGAVVAVEIGAYLGRPGVRLAVLATRARGSVSAAEGQVVHEPVGVD